jgi:hypothetical protein
VRINQCELIESFMEVQSDFAAASALALTSKVTEAVLVALSNAIEDLLPLVPGLLDAIGEVRSGEIRRVAIRGD